MATVEEMRTMLQGRQAKPPAPARHDGKMTKSERQEILKHVRRFAASMRLDDVTEATIVVKHTTRGRVQMYVDKLQREGLRVIRGRSTLSGWEMTVWTADHDQRIIASFDEAVKKSLTSETIIGMDFALNKKREGQFTSHIMWHQKHIMDSFVINTNDDEKEKFKRWFAAMLKTTKT